MAGGTETESSCRLSEHPETDHLDAAPMADARQGRANKRASSGSGLGYRPALDGLRAVAVLAVIAYHDNYWWARGGFLGVDVFFVLSGFLITTLLVTELRQAGTLRFAAFWTRRVRRLLPALLLVLCFVGFFTYFVVVPWQRADMRGDMFASLFYVANWRFIFNEQGYFQLFSAASPLRHMWSLAIEEQYYLVWPLIVFACVRVARGSVRLLAAVCVIGSVLSIYVMRTRFQIDNPSAAYYATDARAHPLLIGSLLGAVLVTWRPRLLARRVIAVASLVAAVVVLIRLYDMSGATAGYYHGGSATFAVAVAILICGALQPGLLAVALSIRPLVWIGRISYGLYLWHWPINVWLISSRVGVTGNALNLVRLAVTFGAATLSFYLIESPIRSKTWRPKITAAVFVPAIAAATVAVIAVFGSSGGRLDPVREALGIQRDVVPLAVSAVSAAPASVTPDTGLTTAPAATAPTALAPPSEAATEAQEQPPSYVWGYGDPLLCGPPRPVEAQEAVNAAADFLPTLPPSARDERILLVGDSTACSLWPGLGAVGRTEGIATDQGSVFGCGVASGEITTTRDEAVTPHSSRCTSLVDVTLRNAFVAVGRQLSSG